MKRSGQSLLSWHGLGTEERMRRLTIVLGAPLAVVVSVLALMQLI